MPDPAPPTDVAPAPIPAPVPAEPLKPAAPVVEPAPADDGLTDEQRLRGHPTPYVNPVLPHDPESA